MLVLTELRHGDILCSKETKERIAVLEVMGYEDLECMKGHSLTQRDKEFRWVNYITVDTPKDKRRRASLFQHHLEHFKYYIDYHYMVMKTIGGNYDSCKETEEKE